MSWQRFRARTRIGATSPPKGRADSAPSNTHRRTAAPLERDGRQNQCPRACCLGTPRGHGPQEGT